LLFLVGIVALALGAFYTALVVATQIDQIFIPDNQFQLGGSLGKLPGIDKGNTDGIGGGRQNILVMGLDRRPSEGDIATRTDTMFVMTIDPSTHTARGLALPRDLYVDIPLNNGRGNFKERINTAYEYGGAEVVKKVVSDLLGIKLDHYVVIDFEGFKQAINLLGGIDVEVPPPGVNDPYYSETELRGDYYPCVFQPGLYHFDGSQALCYARVRYNTSDLDRILRQQRIMFAVMDKVDQLDVLADPTNVVNLWKTYKNTITTDFNDLQIPGFARLAASIDQNQIAFLSLGAATTPFTTREGAAVLVPSEAGIKQLVDAFISDNRLQTEAASIEVQNGTGIEGGAQKTSDYFVSLGIPQSSLVTLNAASSQAKTEIIDFAGKEYTAERLADWLSLSKSAIRKSTSADLSLRNSQSDIVVILGPDAKVPDTIDGAR
jgi:LCP family protein required for cell wall assembly